MADTPRCPTGLSAKSSARRSPSANSSACSSQLVHLRARSSAADFDCMHSNSGERASSARHW
eukprot:6658840-Prymnesium_polylepis.1